MRSVYLLGPLLLALAGCADDDIVKPVVETGTIHLTATYDGEVPEGAVMAVAVMGCPFTMPPLVNPAPSFPVSAFPAEGDFVEIPAGDHCLYIMMDVDLTDGPSPHPGDAINVLDGAQSIPVTVVAGQTTELEVELTLYETGAGGAGGEGGAGGAGEDITVEVTINCAPEICDTDARVLFYGGRGNTIVVPDYYHPIESPSFPLQLTLDVSRGIFNDTPVDWAAGTTTFQAYQDTVEGGRQVQEGEPVSAPLTMSLSPGSNTVELTLQ